MTEVSKFLNCLNRGNVRILRDIYAKTTKTYVVAEVKHTAKGIATVRGKSALALFLSCKNHGRATELLYEHGGRAFRAKVAEEHADSIDTILTSPVKSFESVFLVLDGHRAVINFRKFCLVHFFHQSLHSGLGEGYWETVTAYTDDSKFNYWLINHTNCN